MRVKCILCDKIEDIDDHAIQAKKLRNRPIHTYMCQECHGRISERTEKRVATGQFRITRNSQPESEW
jgi:uncharacterized protein YlaI